MPHRPDDLAVGCGIRTDRRREQESLPEGRAHPPQPAELVIALDAFGDDADPQAVGEIHDAAHELPEAPSDMVSDHLLSDAGRDVIRLGGLALNAAKAKPVKAAGVALAIGVAVGLLARSRGRRPHR